jgi:hypothetical protein
MRKTVTFPLVRAVLWRSAVMRITLRRAEFFAGRAYDRPAVAIILG